MIPVLVLLFFRNEDQDELDMTLQPLEPVQISEEALATELWTALACGDQEVWVAKAKVALDKIAWVCQVILRFLWLCDQDPHDRQRSSACIRAILKRLGEARNARTAQIQAVMRESMRIGAVSSLVCRREALALTFCQLEIWAVKENVGGLPWQKQFLCLCSLARAIPLQLYNLRDPLTISKLFPFFFL